MAAENLLSDARVRTATLAADGPYLPDGGGLRVRLKPPSREHPDGARLFEYHFKTKNESGAWKHAAMHLGTYGDLYVDANGRRRRYSIARARVDRDAARDLVAKGIDPREARRLRELEEKAEQQRKLAEHETQANRKTVQDAFDAWRSLYLKREHKDGGALVEGHFQRNILPAIGDKALQDIGKADLLPILDGLVENGRNRTANVILATARQFFRWCMARDWIAHDPTFGLTKKAVGGKDAIGKRTLSFDEIALLPERLLESNLPERMRCAVWLLLATGARVGELSGARVSDFDFALAYWRIPAERSKNGVEHLIHLSDFALEHAHALVKDGKKSEWILPGRDPKRHVDEKTLTKLIRDRQRKARVKGRSKQTDTLLLPGGAWTAHDLRRTMASRMQDIGVAPHVIEKCLNHTLDGIAAVYQHAELLPERKQAFERWGAKVAATLRGEGPVVLDMATAKKRRARKGAP